LSPLKAALTEPLANGVHVAGLLKEASPKVVVVFGAGPIGLLAMQAIRLVYGARVAVVDRLADRLEVATKLGAELVLTPEQLEDLNDWAGADGIEASVDAVGAGPTKASSVEILRPGGTAVWIGLHADESPVSSYSLVLPEKRILGSYACTQEELGKALGWIADGSVDVSSWTSTFSLEESDKAFATMLNPGPNDLKAVLDIG
jgi:L-iditol 2-dehydrogenase